MDSLEYILEHISKGGDHLQDTVVDGRKTLLCLALLRLRAEKWWALVHVAVRLLFS